MINTLHFDQGTLPGLKCHYLQNYVKNVMSVTKPANVHSLSLCDMWSSLRVQVEHKLFVHSR